MNRSLFHLAKTTRPPFLLLAPVCVFLGMALAISSGSKINLNHLSLISIAALLASIGVNTLNEYFDFKSGLDAKTKRTPFSGGSGTLQQYPELASRVLLIGIVSSFLALLSGLYFVFYVSWWLLPGGVISLLLVFFYTSFITRFPLLSLLAPGLAFGLVLILSTAYILSGQLTISMVLLSLVPFFLINNLLLLNQFPDIKADRNIGRKNYPVMIGERKSSWIFVLFLTLAYASLFSAGFFEPPGYLSLIGMLTLAFAIPATTGLFKYLASNEGLTRCLALNVATTLLTPLLIGIGLIIG